MKNKKVKYLGLVVAFISSVVIAFPTPASAAAAAPTADRIYGIDRFETAAKIAEAGWTGTSDYAVLASGADSHLVDALVAGPLAAKVNAPILLTQGDSLNTYAEQELSRLNVKTVYVTMTSGSGVNLNNIVQEVKAIPSVSDVELLGGSDSSETSVKIAQKLEALGTKVSKVVVVGASGVDALSVSSIAGAEGMPILYTDLNSIPACVSDFLKSTASTLKGTYIIGGNGVVSDAVAAKLPAPVNRIGGANRYETNIDVLENFVGSNNFQASYLANGNTMVDALAVAPLAARNSAPILLTSYTLPPASADYAKGNLSPNQIALGGEAVVTPTALSQLSSCQTISQDNSTQGGTAASPATFSEAVKISGNSVTLSNVTTNDSIYIQGNNAKLDNVVTKGTIVIDPGSGGSAVLSNVKAANIVILSGGYSIDLQDVTADTLVNDAQSDYLILSENTAIKQSIITQSVSLDNSYGGSFGHIYITDTSVSAPPEIELAGTYTQPISVNSAATVAAAANYTIGNVVIDPDDSSQLITMQGSFSNVSVSFPPNLMLGGNTVLQTLTNNTKQTITVNMSAQSFNVAAQSSKSNINTNNQLPYYFGSDSGTGTAAYKSDFYIGQLGYGTHQHFDGSTGGDDKNGSYFNGNGAAASSAVYGYWLLSGMSSAPSGVSAAVWGQQQAQLAYKAYTDLQNYYGAKVKAVIFIDIEACSGGLDTQDYANNQAIYAAFVSWLNNNTSVAPGTYSSPHEWNSLTMGSNYSPLSSGYYWLADYPGGTPDQSKLTTANQFWVKFPQTDEQAQIWQFEGTPDYDVARVLPG